MAISKETSLASLPGGAGLPSGPGGPKEPYSAAVADQTVRFPGLLKDKSFWRLVRSVLIFLWSLVRLSKVPRSEAEAKEADLIKNLLIDLGPTYIKLGQFLSVRRDLLPVRVADELATLQDRVPPFDLERVRETIKVELGAAPEDLFTDFDPQPIASASIGQVHKVVLKDGRAAVVKVQRPNLAGDFYRDLGLLRLVAKGGIAFDQIRRRLTGNKTNGRPARFDFRNWLEMSNEFGKTLFAEIDYLVEGRNADRLRRHLRDRTDVRVPRVIWRYSARRVLALEYIEATKISATQELMARGVDLGNIGNILITCYLEQIVINGFFHADPHAGNLAVDADGRLVIFDYGMMGEISEQQRRALFSCVVATINRDAESMVRGLAELGVARAGANHEAISRALSPFMDYYAGQSIFELDFRQLERDIDTVISERSLRLPANLAYILRTGSSLEGIARTLKSDFSFIQAVKPIVKKLLVSEGLENLSSLAGLVHLAGQAVSTLRKTGDSEKPRANGKNLSEQISCRRCHEREDEQLRLEKSLRQIKRDIYGLSALALGYTALSLGTIVVQVLRLAPDDANLYFVIGNIILGGIMIGKFIRLSRRKPESPDQSHHRTMKTGENE